MGKEKTATRRELISHHVFLLPFKWQKEGSSAYDIEDFAQLVKQCKASLENSRWLQRPFSQQRITDYNEYHYFYDYVAEVLYQTEPVTKDSRAEDLFIAHYSFDIAPGTGTYAITAPNPHKPGRKTYILEVDSVLLHMFYSGVGILSFHLNNREPDQKHPKDILAINQFGRRVFPNFYPIPPDEVGFQSAFTAVDSTTYPPGGIELAYCIGLDLGLTEAEAVDLEQMRPSLLSRNYHSWIENWAGGIEGQLKDRNNYYLFRMPEMLIPLIGMLENGYDIKPVLDDRMFVMCWYGNDSLATHLTTGSSQQNYITNDWWYRYVFVDGNSMRTVQNEQFQAEVVKKATYNRWTGLQTLYGVSEYSFVLLTDSLPKLRENKDAFLVTHFQTIYYRLTELVLLQRASIQRFSDDITHITQLDGLDAKIQSETELTQADLARRLNRRYIRFINRIYFREVTPQQQGIELYDMLQTQARVPGQVHALQEEIERLQNYVQQETDRHLLNIERVLERTEKVRANDERIKEVNDAKAKSARDEANQQKWNLLTLLGALFLAPSVIFAAYSLSFFEVCFSEVGIWGYLVAFLAACISGIMTYDLFWNASRLYANKKLNIEIEDSNAPSVVKTPGDSYGDHTITSQSEALFLIIHSGRAWFYLLVFVGLLLLPWFSCLIFDTYNS
ncbi:Mg2+ and Co2+ transporter CorA [Lewinella aquimaris]|uniref:Mg2+ and Co2+ transporter CorA n=1 Tax=Neolewinella aquimaris TaxID=1835722 RepID=A0A840EEE0_9BACT|nr:hypothetical protein [Neolewinella aquimaris]MBB4080318.1 Mg2+ and Co2+ transporter CorA [Neolewinella aquimaris]